MSKNNRPKCITAIGRFWIISGVVMLPIVIIIAIGFPVVLDQIKQSTPVQNMPSISSFILIAELILILLIPICIFCIVSGINFLKLKPWAHKVLEIFSWLLLILLVGGGIFSSVHLFSSAKVFFPSTVVLSWALLVVSLAIILKYLRGNTVKKAFGLIAEPVDEPVTPEIIDTEPSIHSPEEEKPNEVLKKSNMPLFIMIGGWLFNFLYYTIFQVKFFGEILTIPDLVGIAIYVSAYTLLCSIIVYVPLFIVNLFIVKLLKKHEPSFFIASLIISLLTFAMISLELYVNL